MGLGGLVLFRARRRVGLALAQRPHRAPALLLGRVTYQGFAEAWPSRDGVFSDKFNGMQKYVV